MATGTVVKENGVLKLVHPGGFVELRKEPTTAAEVMKKNPRHCVTRPDVFKYPWIVVRPESVLKPGRVFFIVPNRTIYRLLHAYEPSLQQPSLRNPKHHDHRRGLKQTSLVESMAKVTPTYHDRDPHVKRQSPVESRTKVKPKTKYSDQQSPTKSRDEVIPMKQDRRDPHVKRQSPVESCAKVKPKPKYRDHYRFLNQQSPTKSWDEVIPMKQDREDHLKKQSLLESWPEVIDDHQEHNEQFNQVSPISYLVKVRPSPTREYAFDDNHGGVAISTKENGGLEYKSSNQVTSLKSCLRKHRDNARRSCGLRVIFILPSEEDEESRRKIGKSQHSVQAP